MNSNLQKSLKQLMKQRDDLSNNIHNFVYINLYIPNRMIENECKRHNIELNAPMNTTDFNNVINKLVNGKVSRRSSFTIIFY